MKGSRAVSPVLATLLMIAVAVSMSVILFMWSQGFLATTSEAASSQQSAQNVAAQSSITIESVQFTDAKDSGGNTLSGGTHKAIKIIVRNVGSSKVTIGQVYIGTSTYQMTAYSVYKVMKTSSAAKTPGTDYSTDTYTYVIIGNEASGGTAGPVWYVHKDAIVDADELVEATATSAEGYDGTLAKIAAEYADIDGKDINETSNTDVDVTQQTDTAMLYAFDSDWSSNTEGVIEPQGFGVIHIYLSSAWSAGETYFVKVTTTVGTFAETTVTAPS